MSDLLVAPCSHDAAKFAVLNWHYSASMPIAKLVKFGAWENDKFIGAIIFGRGANKNLGKEFNLAQTEVCELVRIALTTHESPVSKIASLALKLVKKQSPGLRLVVSYADPAQDHVGLIYQAMNWLYVGKTDNGHLYYHKGQWVHKRSAHSFYGSTKGLKKKQTSAKHKYLYPFDRTMRRQIEPLVQPYPKRADD